MDAGLAKQLQNYEKFSDFTNNLAFMAETQSVLLRSCFEMINFNSYASFLRIFRCFSAPARRAKALLLGPQASKCLLLTTRDPIAASNHQKIHRKIANDNFRGPFQNNFLSSR